MARIHRADEFIITHMATLWGTTCLGIIGTNIFHLI